MPTQEYIAKYEEADWRDALEIEVQGFYNTVRAALPHMKQSGGGSFVHLGTGGDLAWPNRDGLSVVPKAANEALVRGLAKEEGRHGIRANSVLIGVIEAGMYLKFKEQGVFDDKWVMSTLRQLAIKRLGKPEEVADAVVFLASDRASYVTGQQIAVAGGYGL
jgi:NAD(P)-dependent dehydrogenase (short-subunit alcohol dehydrogenase family)